MFTGHGGAFVPERRLPPGTQYIEICILFYLCKNIGRCGIKSSFRKLWALRLGVAVSQGRGVSWEVPPHPLHGTRRPRKVEGLLRVLRPGWAARPLSAQHLCQQGPGTLWPPPLPALLALRPTPVCLGPLPPDCPDSSVYSADHAQQDKAAFVGPSALRLHGVPSGPGLPAPLWLPPLAPVWVGGSQRILQVGSGGPDGALGGERPCRDCVPPSTLGLVADSRARAGPALHTPTPFCTHVHAQAGQGPHVCTHMHAHVCSHAARAKISTHTFSQNLGVRTRTREAMWAPHPPPGAGPGELRREEHTFCWGRGVGGASVAVEPAGWPWARLGLQSAGEGQRTWCAQPPLPNLAPPRPWWGLRPPPLPRPRAESGCCGEGVSLSLRSGPFPSTAGSSHHLPGGQETADAHLHRAWRHT